MSARAETGIISRSTLIAIILAGVFAFCAFVVLSAYAPVLRDGNDGGGHAMSKSAAGYGFLADLLKESGMDVMTSRGGAASARDGLLVYTPRAFNAFEDFESLDRYQITLVILPKWETAPHPGKRGWVMRIDELDLSPVRFAFDDFDVTVEAARGEDVSDIILEGADAFGGMIAAAVPSRNIGRIEEPQRLIPSEDIEPVITAQNGDIFFAKLKDLPVYVISDPDLANTQGLANVDRARMTALFIDRARAGGPVVFDLSQHGFERTRNIVRLALEPPFLAATLCAVFAALLLALKGAARFGPAQAASRPFEAGKAALADNSAALIRMAKREEAFGERYADLIRRRIAHAVGAPKTLPPPALDALIDKLGARQGAANFTTLFNQARGAGNVHAFVSAARRLYNFRKEITRDHL
ncbi:MAG: hypothetical protein R3C58_04855 [Parvularculaceae bacterium]